MKADIFSTFRLVGGTALSLHLGHRESVDIDLFSDVPYGSLDFESIDNYLKDTFSYVDHLSNIASAMGKSSTIGNDKNNSVKLDVFYADPFIQELIEEDNIRLASIEEIIAMKLDVIQRGGRKKDFWDLHELLDKYSISQMVALHEERYP
ncbi:MULTISPECIES: nucleotidyl transferase AbiEii/AbiGii toxin family protein [unclassified Sphingobacterium]|uniref:nucleotidyl transferase AbiEii/AbiGii toxin family protein n=1 Tax=unclassified Sphingobacterium TaxID=2609468 RepID=UPI0025ECCAF7|nr:MULTISPECIES: nucleotidyl transferase AbiEii/AbiGii toxin family protein [unclassified Sphingobacterium]